MPLSTIAKRVVPADYQKLVEAGYLTDSLETTEAGRMALMQLTLVEFEADFIAKANEKIAEQKKKDEAKA